MSGMGRREFVALLGGAAAWPLAARAQPGERMRRVGIVTSVLETDADAQARYAVLRQALQQLGWTEERNIKFDQRFGSAGDSDVVRRHAQELEVQHETTPVHIAARRRGSCVAARGARAAAGDACDGVSPQH